MILQKSFWLAAQETFLIINVENTCAASYFWYIIKGLINEWKIHKNSIYLK